MAFKHARARTRAADGVLDCGRVETLRFRFADRSRDDLVLGPGVHAVGTGPDGPRLVGDADDARLQVSVDGRGSWLQLREGASRVHVNGRPVRRMALLRPGDAVHIDGVELALAGAAPRPVTGTQQPQDEGATRQVLRGVGGHHHGRCFTLDRPRSLGSATDSDIRLDGPGIQDRHLLLLPQGADVVLQMLDEHASCTVNGHPATEALLGPGDQVVVGNGQRFVLESPLVRTPAPRPVAREYSVDDEDTAPVDGAVAGSSWRHLPWVLLAAALLAGALALLLTWGG